MFDIGEATIFVTLAGSQAHGTAHAGSDIDLRGVCVAPFEQRVSLFQHFEQSEAPLTGDLWQVVSSRLAAHPSAARAQAARVESVVFDVAKFLSLCAAANPNALEILFADERDWVFETALFRRIHAERGRFLTRKVGTTYLGYALSQLKRIRTHRSWLLEPPRQKPTRAAFGLPESGTLGRDDQNRLSQAVDERLRGYGADDLEMPKASRLALTERLAQFWCDTLACSEDDLDERLRAVATHALNVPAEVASALQAEKRYLGAMKEWQSFETWLAERNPARAALERQHGYDTKHAMHLVRLLRMGLEVLEIGELRVRRADAAELDAVRNGAFSYDDLTTLTNELTTRINAARAACRLPEDVPNEWVDELCRDVLLSAESMVKG